MLGRAKRSRERRGRSDKGNMVGFWRGYEEPSKDGEDVSGIDLLEDGPLCRLFVLSNLRQSTSLW